MTNICHYPWVKPDGQTGCIDLPPGSTELFAKATELFGVATWQVIHVEDDLSILVDEEGLHTENPPLNIPMLFGSLKPVVGPAIFVNSNPDPEGLFQPPDLEHELFERVGEFAHVLLVANDAIEMAKHGIVIAVVSLEDLIGPEAARANDN